MRFPDPATCELDFSVFHPLMHRAFSPECFGWHGGPIHHIRMWYEYQFEYSHDRIWHRLTGCLWGKHQTTSVWTMPGRHEPDRRPRPVARVCHWCDWRHARGA